MILTNKMKNFKQYIGIILGALYGLIFRFVLEIYNNGDDVFTITFLFVVPLIISVIPIFFHSSELYKSSLKSYSYPVFSVILFFFMAFFSRLEDLSCLLILVIPFVFIAGIVGMIISFFVGEHFKRKRIYSIVFLPFLLIPIENILPDKTEFYSVQSRIIINQSPETIWNNIIEVPEIKEDEYKKGFYNNIGIPRPLYSKLEEKNGIIYRIGYFSEGLQLYETISEKKENEFVNFKINIEESVLRDTPTDKHVLKGNYFKFENISYKLNKSDNGQTELILTCDYQITSKMNGYANFWAKNIIKDFEVRLLQSIKHKLEK